MTTNLINGYSLPLSSWENTEGQQQIHRYSTNYDVSDQDPPKNNYQEYKSYQGNQAYQQNLTYSNYQNQYPSYPLQSWNSLQSSYTNPPYLSGIHSDVPSSNRPIGNRSSDPEIPKSQSYSVLPSTHSIQSTYSNFEKPQTSTYSQANKTFRQSYTATEKSQYNHILNETYSNAQQNQLPPFTQLDHPPASIPRISPPVTQSYRTASTTNVPSAQQHYAYSSSHSQKAEGKAQNGNNTQSTSFFSEYQVPKAYQIQTFQLADRNSFPQPPSPSSHTHNNHAFHQTNTNNNPYKAPSPYPPSPHRRISQPSYQTTQHHQPPTHSNSSQSYHPSYQQNHNHYSNSYPHQANSSFHQQVPTSYPLNPISSFSQPSQLRPQPTTQPTSVYARSGSSISKLFQIQANELDFGLTPTVLGSGTFGVVHLAKYRGDVVAVKIPKLGFDDFQKEKDILLSLRHRNIVLCQGEVHLPNGQQGIVLEYMAQGTLKDYIEKYNPLTDETKISLSLGIAKGLAFLHGEEIFHRDLSHNNVLIDDVGTAKITDFGKARPISNVLGTSGTIGTYLWMPPEAFNNAYCKASDIFSFGILMWEMETGSTNPGPQNQDGQNVVDVINWRKSGGIPKIREGILSELIKACLKLDPQQRPGAVDIVNYLTTFQMRIR